MKKIKRLFSNVKGGSSDSSSQRGSLGGRQGSISSVAGHSLQYEVKLKDLDKIHKAVLNQDEKKVEQLAPRSVNARDKEDRTPLHFACAVGNVAIVAKLLSWKAQINVPDKEYKTPLFKAIECGHEDCAQLLIEARADLKASDKEGNSCVHYLCRQGFVNLLPLVLQKLMTADVEKKNKLGFNSLHVAIEKKHADVVEMLLKKKVNVDMRDARGYTPLMIACNNGCKDIVSMLLREDADATIKGPNGFTAADIAMKMGHEDCVKEIEFFNEPDSQENDEDDDAIDGVSAGDGDGGSGGGQNKSLSPIRETETRRNSAYESTAQPEKTVVKSTNNVVDDDDDDDDDEESALETNDFYQKKREAVASEPGIPELDESEQTETETNKASLALSKILNGNAAPFPPVDNKPGVKEDDGSDSDTKPSGKFIGKSIRRTSSLLSRSSAKKNTFDDDDDDDDDDDAGGNLLSNQKKFASQIGNFNSITLESTKIQNSTVKSSVPVSTTGTSHHRESTVSRDNNEDENSPWDSSTEDVSKLNSKKAGESSNAVGQDQNTFPLSEIKYPIMTEKFQNLGSSSHQQLKNEAIGDDKTVVDSKKQKTPKGDFSFESSDEESADVPVLNNKDDKLRRMSSLENQIGTFTKKEESTNHVATFDEVVSRKSTNDNWDSTSEDASEIKPPPNHPEKLERRSSGGFLPAFFNQASSALRKRKSSIISPMNSISEFVQAKDNNVDKIEELTKNLEESERKLKLQKEEISSLKDAVLQVEVAKRKLQSEIENLKEEQEQLKLENERVQKGLKESYDDDADEVAARLAELRATVDRLTKENQKLKQENSELLDKLDSDERSRNKKSADHDMAEVSSLKEEIKDLLEKLQTDEEKKTFLTFELNELKRKIKNYEDQLESNQKQTKQLELNAKSVRNKSSEEMEALEDELRAQKDACQSYMKQVAEQSSNLSKMEFDKLHFKTQLNEKTTQLEEVQRELSRKVAQCEIHMNELLLEKEKSITFKGKLESCQGRLEMLQRDLENAKTTNQTISSSFSDGSFAKIELVQKIQLLEELNSDLKGTVSKLREELSSQRNKHEEEFKKLTLSKNELFNKLVISESSHEKDTISIQFLETELRQLTQEYERLKQKFSEEQSSRQTAEFQLLSINQQIELSKSSTSNIENKLTQKMDSLAALERENESLKTKMHALEIANVRTEANLNMEKQLKEKLQEEVLNLRNKLSNFQHENHELQKTQAQLEHEIKGLSGSQNIVAMEAENHRELWESEVKSKSKLGLREQTKLRKSLERQHVLEEELRQEKQRSESLSEALNDVNTQSSGGRHKSQRSYNSSKYLIDTKSKQSRHAINSSRERRRNSNDFDDEIFIDVGMRREIEKMKEEIERRTQAEFVEKLHQVYRFLEEQSIIRNRNEQKRIENMEHMKKNLQTHHDMATSSFKAHNFLEKSDEIQQWYNELKESETRLRDRMTQKPHDSYLLTSESPSRLESRKKTYTTENILQQLEKSIKTYNSTM